MDNLTFVTSNELKFRIAKQICDKFGVPLTQTVLDITEIQSEDAEQIALDKARRVYEVLQKPIIVTDDSWKIPGLNNFPGPYMKSMNSWLAAEDWLRLTAHLSDRRIFVQQVAAYFDGQHHKVFSHEIEGLLLKEIRGSSRYPHNTIVSFNGGDSSSAEVHAEGKSAVAEHKTVWHLVAPWVLEESKK